jgi:hypothetical protein
MPYFQRHFVRLPNCANNFGCPGLDFETWEITELGVSKNEKRLVEPYRLPHLKIEMWTTRDLKGTGFSPYITANKDSIQTKRGPQGPRSRVTMPLSPNRVQNMIVPAGIWHEVFDRANGYCEYCGQDLLVSRAAYASAQVDHVLARAKQGLHSLDNLRLACCQCNSSLSKYNHLTTFEERRDLAKKKIEEYHQRNYQEKWSKLRGSIGACSA